MSYSFNDIKFESMSEAKSPQGFDLSSVYGEFIL